MSLRAPSGLRPTALPLLAALLAAAAAAAAQDAPAPGHHGPPVAPGDSGPARHVEALYRIFDPEAAMRDLAISDRGYRAPGDPEYDAAVDHIVGRLRGAGFGREPRLTLRVLETEMESPVWIPRSASLTLRRGGRAEVLHAFSRSADIDRVMLPIHAPSADVEGRPVFGLSDVAPGTILVTPARLDQSLLRRAEKRGAVAALSSRVFSFTVDPTGRERHLDAILFTQVAAGTTFPVAQISPRVQQRIEDAAAAGEAWIAFTADVETGGSTVRTLVAEVVGAVRPQEAVAIASHVQEPGAGDNASGAAGMTESAVSYARALREGLVPWPDRTLCFVWGDEMRQTSVFLADTDRVVLAGLSADMLGQSAEETGAVALLERTPDPGALVTIAPDEHTPWGTGEVLPEDLRPNGLNVVLRTALFDVGRHLGGWTTSENPWEGGSDHDVFLEHGIPGVLLWHFTDFTYHTSLDRMDMVDPEELRRSCTAVMAAALGVASAGPADLDRYLASNELERELRVRVATQAGEDENAEQWEEWCAGAADWLRMVCAPRAGK